GAVHGDVRRGAEVGAQVVTVVVSQHRDRHGGDGAAQIERVADLHAAGQPDAERVPVHLVGDDFGAVGNGGCARWHDGGRAEGFDFLVPVVEAAEHAERGPVAPHEIEAAVDRQVAEGA